MMELWKWFRLFRLYDNGIVASAIKAIRIKCGGDVYMHTMRHRLKADRARRKAA